MSSVRTQLFNNSITALKLGIQDYELAIDDSLRLSSSARNIYSGILLLMKLCLTYAVNDDQVQIIISKNFTFDYDPINKKVNIKAKTENTVDYSELVNRFKIIYPNYKESNYKYLNNLNDIRNKFEHKYCSATKIELEYIIATACTVIPNLFNLIDKSPKISLGEEWDKMIKIKGVFDSEKNKTKKEIGEAITAGIIDKNDFITIFNTVCPRCKTLLLTISADDTLDRIVYCRACESRITLNELKEIIIEDIYGLSYRDIKQGLEEVIFNCPECGNKSYISNYEKDECEICGFSRGENKYCKRCGNEIHMDEYGDEDGHCSWCRNELHKMEYE